MRYIYYIGIPTGKIDLSAAGGNYIGQGNDDDFGRMLEHLRIAYGNHDGPIKGSEELIRRVGASDVFFGVYYASQNYGLDKQLFIDMTNAGGDLTSPDAQLDAAEIMHIISHDGDLSGGNIATGGQGALVGRSSGTKGVSLFNQRYPNAQKEYEGNLNEVKVLGTDPRNVAIKKLCNPDDYVVFRAASLALEQDILYNSTFLKQLVSLYVNPTTRGSVTSTITTKVTEVINNLNNNIFQAPRIKSHNVGALAELIKTKFLEGIQQRVAVMSINILLDDLIKNKYTIESYVVNGVPNFQRKINDTNVAYKINLHIKRSELVSLIPNYQPQGYINLMSNPAPPPVNNSKNSGAIHRYVEACVYSIFKAHYKTCTDATQPPAPVTLSNGQPAILRPPEPTLRHKMADIYRKYRPMTYFFSFYSYAINILQRENSRGLSQLIPNSNNSFGQKEFGDYTFEPSIGASTGFYSGSEDTVNQIMSFDGVNEIPSGTG